VRNWRWILLCILAVIFPFAYCQFWKDPPISTYKGKNCAAILKMMPGRDKERLKYFFRESIGWDALGYVLFGNKPMSFGGCDQKIDPFKNLVSFCHAISPQRSRKNTTQDPTQARTRWTGTRPNQAVLLYDKG
jgi:hypothetical protein